MIETLTKAIRDDLDHHTLPANFGHEAGKILPQSVVFAKNFSPSPSNSDRCGHCGGWIDTWLLIS